MSWFSDHVYDAGHIAGDTKDLSADIIGSVTSKVTFGYWDFEWEDLEGNIFNSSLGQGLYAFGNFMNREYGEEEEEAASIKGPGKMRGRDPEMAFNEGVKGYGRSSLRIGEKGMGKPKTGKYKEYRSGRTSRGYG